VRHAAQFPPGEADQERLGLVRGEQRGIFGRERHDLIKIGLMPAARETEQPMRSVMTLAELRVWLALRSPTVDCVPGAAAHFTPAACAASA
jgi:hypothetical protein